ncbi:DNA internalization-related competence protein ComEC/Rec2 [Bacillus sp. FJAT-42376]|uniref:DNA internalization-related competence protein ComEC/Rec2 n=1 Tax=Bacillus sp. FJAT-42376 TaxID=2014076 RepID=UPI000F5120EB|nr:DNA internalization-related competence protein ComEC/Rec2 [Bacillus sp. FJAT-42376]AZB43691.1 DNA internalization-related competence protein ComEC/Rec2 [Bacillus sp. FJAT-42376]
MTYVLCAAASVIGILSARYSAEWAGFLIVLIWSLIHSARKRENAGILAPAVFFFFVLLTSFHSYFTETDFREGPFSGRGMLTVHPNVDGDRFGAIMKLNNYESAALRLFIKDEADQKRLRQLSGGMICTVSGKLEPPLRPTIPNGFHYKEYLEAQSIHWMLTASSIGDCTKGSSPEALLLQLRSQGLAFIIDSFPAESAGIVQALIFGEREWINKDTETAYQKVGVIHLLAISGMQVALIAAAGRFVLMRMGVSREGSSWILFLLMPCYLVIAGGSPSVLRAVAAVELYFLFLIMRWPVRPLKLLSLLFMIWLAVNPSQLFLSGFQLTFIISFCLLVSTSIFKKYPKNILFQNLLLTFLSMISTMPLILHSFWELSLISLIVNLIYVPLYSFLIMPVSLCSFLIALFQAPFWENGVWLASLLINGTNRMTEAISAADPFLLKPGKPPAGLMIAYIAGVFYCLWTMEKGAKKAAGAVFILMGLLIADHILPYFDSAGSVTFLDVGQGDCIVIELPYNAGVYVIDTGGKLSYQAEDAEWRKRREEKQLSDYTLLSYLSSKGISNLDGVFLTHADQDHTGEYLHILKKIGIEKLVVPEGFVRDEKDRELITETLKKGIPVYTARGHEMVKEKAIEFQVLWPSAWSESKNEDSLVLRFHLGGKWWVLTGDLEKEGEAAMLKTIGERLETDVLKAGHHGSKNSTSDELLSKMAPSAAVLSAGRKNRYGHPHYEVIKRLNDHGILPLRTDQSGTIQYFFIGEKGTFISYPPYDGVTQSGRETKK